VAADDLVFPEKVRGPIELTVPTQRIARLTAMAGVKAGEAPSGRGAPCALPNAEMGYFGAFDAP